MGKKSDYESDYESGYESSEYSDQSGGDSEVSPSENELDISDSENLDIDPDDEADLDQNEDDKYDPVNESEESEDPEETEPEDEEIIDDELAESNIDEDSADEFVPESKVCYQKHANKEDILLDEDDSSIYGKLPYTKVPDEERISDPVLTYYELVGVIGTRAQQFYLGAPPLVKGIENLHPAKMAYIELMAKMTPFIIKRNLPGKKYEEWRIDELEIIHKINDELFTPKNFDMDALMTYAKQQDSQLITKNQPSRISDSPKSPTSEYKPTSKSSKTSKPSSKSSSKTSKTSKSSSKTSGSSKTSRSSSKTSKTPLKSGPASKSAKNVPKTTSKTLKSSKSTSKTTKNGRK